MERPTSVTVFGVLNILFGILGVCGGLFGLFGVLATMGMVAADAMQQAGVQMDYGPVTTAWNLISTLLGLVLSVAVFTAGIGLFLAKEWARLICVYYSLIQFVLVPIGLIFTIVVIYPQMQEQMGDVPGAAAGGIGGALCGSVFGLVYAGLLFYFMTRDHVKAWFQAAQYDGGDIE